MEMGFHLILVKAMTRMGVSLIGNKLSSKVIIVFASLAMTERSSRGSISLPAFDVVSVLESGHINRHDL